jgi:glyoxylase-like metal-dependent hydrolase (beta-lactamase superfamily II)
LPLLLEGEKMCYDISPCAQAFLSAISGGSDEMGRERDKSGLTRRQLLQGGGVLAGSAIFAYVFPNSLFARPGALSARAAAAAAGYAQQGAAKAPADPVAAMRAQMGAIPIESTKLSDNLTLLSGPGGNVVVLHGADGKIVVDCFMQPAWPKLKQDIDGMGNGPIKLLSDTHWHFDHTDNNAHFHDAGVPILAHENTKKRMSEAHDLLGMHFDPSPANALPTQLFKERHTMQANGEDLELGYIPPAHTDSDIYVWYKKANVLHCGDVFFNGMYPFIDAGTRGSITGQIAVADKLLKMADNNTKIIPGHGPLGDKAALTKYRGVMVAIRERVAKLKSGGKSLDAVLAGKASAEFEGTWGKGLLMPNDFVAIVYNTL